jgi:hypothetical protein
MIPWAESWVTESMVFQQFRREGWGWILRVDMVSVPARGAKREHQKVFIHFRDWTPEHEHFLEFLSKEPEEDKSGSYVRKIYPEVKVFYKEDYYWKVRKSTWKPREEGQGGGGARGEGAGARGGGRRGPEMSFGGTTVSSPVPLNQYGLPVISSGQFSVLEVDEPSSPTYAPQSPTPEE